MKERETMSIPALAMPTNTRHAAQAGGDAIAAQ